MLLTAIFPQKIQNNLSGFGAKPQAKSPVCLERTPQRDTVSFKSRTALDKFYAQNGLQTQEAISAFLRKHVKPENLLGVGRNFKAYSMGDYVLRVVADGNAERLGYQGFTSTEYLMQGRNFGQVIAKNNEWCEISRRVHGTPLYSAMPKPWIEYCHSPSMIGTKEAEAYCEQLGIVGAFSDKTLSQYIDDVAFTRNEGFCLDFRNPNNFLYDEKTGSINIIDMALGRPYYTSCELATPLFDKELLPDYYKYLMPSQRKQTLETIVRLEERLKEIAVDKNTEEIKPCLSYTARRVSKNIDSIDFKNPDFAAVIVI